MNIYLRPFRDHESEADRNYPFILPGASPEDTSQSTGSLVESIEELNAVSESTTPFTLFVGGWQSTTEYSSELIKRLTPVSESITSGIFSYQSSRFQFNLFLQMMEIIRSELPQPPETRWIQNLRHPSYQFRQSVPILVESTGDIVTATYDDVGLSGTGESVEAAIPDLCAKIVAHYEKLKANGVKSQEYTFLKHIIEEIQSPAWEDFKQLYQEKLKELPYVQKGYINIDGKNADVVIILSEESVDLIKQLAKIDLDLNLQFRPLCFQVAYERSTDYLELDDFERFY